MPKRLIIDNQTEMQMFEVMHYVTQVIGLGRISNDNKQYCFATRFESGVIVYSKLNKNSDVLIIRGGEDLVLEKGIEYNNVTNK